MIKVVNFAPGDIVRVYEKIKEIPTGEGKSKEPKTRIQIFEGTVIAISGREEGRSFSVRKIVEGIGVEKTWPLISPSIDKVELKEHSKKRVTKSKLYILRRKTG